MIDEWGKAGSRAQLLMDVLLGEGEMEEHISENERDKVGTVRGKEKVKETRSIWDISHPLNHEIEVLLSVCRFWGKQLMEFAEKQSLW